MFHLDVLSLTVLPLSAAVTPPPGEEVDPNLVTPGVVGFILTFGLALVVVLLVVDMVRRVRRINHRAAVNERLDAEEAAARDAPAD